MQILDVFPQSRISKAFSQSPEQFFLTVGQYNFGNKQSHFLFLVFGHFWRRSYESKKILRNLCLHLARQDGQERNKLERKVRNLSNQNTKNKKTKIWDERNKNTLSKQLTKMEFCCIKAT